MAGVQAQRSVQGALRVCAAVRAEERNGHAQEGGSDVAPLVIAPRGVRRLEAGGQTQQLPRMRDDGFHVAFHQGNAGQRRDHLGRLRTLSEQPQITVARVGVLALRFEVSGLCHQRVGIGGGSRARMSERALGRGIVAVMRLEAAQFHPDRGRLVPEPIRGDQLIGIVAGQLLRRLQAVAKSFRHALRSGHIADGEEQPRQLPVRVGIVRLSLDGSLEVVARLHRLSARDRDPPAEHMRRTIFGVERERGLQLVFRIGDPPLLDQHFREHGVQVRGFGVVEQRLAQLVGGGGEVVGVLRQQRIEIMVIGARADALVADAVCIDFVGMGLVGPRMRMRARQREQGDGGAPPDHPPRPAISASCARPASGDNFQTIWPLASKSRSKRPRPVSWRIRAVASSRERPLAFATWSTCTWPLFFFASASATSEKWRSSVSCSTRALFRPTATSPSPIVATTTPTTNPDRSTNPWPLSTTNAFSINAENAAPRMATKAPPMVRIPLVRIPILYWNDTLGTARAPLSALKYSLGPNPPIFAHHAPGMPRMSVLYCWTASL